jgi:hypothetical protein
LERDERALSKIARYVDPVFVERLGIGSRESWLRRQPGEGRLGTVEGNRVTVEHLYRNVCERHFHYAQHAHRIGLVDPSGGERLRQWIRPPDDVNRYAGNCLDLATLFASACLAEYIAPIIFIGGRTGQGWHAWVMCDLAREPGRIADPLNGSVWGDALIRGEGGCVSVSHELVEKVLESTAFASVDITRAAYGDLGPASFEDACASAREWALGCDVLFAVDVARSHSRHGHEGQTPYRLPELRPAIGCQLPNLATFVNYPERREAQASLVQAAGVRAVVGTPGMGKSTLALRSVWQSARSSAAWFLPASSPSALRQSLGRCEARERIGTDSGLSLLQLERMASDARDLLADSSLPWVLIVDNANLTEGGTAEDARRLLREIPTPDPQRGQSVIVTSTNDAWQEALGTAAVVRLHPLEESKCDLPIPVQLARVPLFVTACRRLLSAFGEPSLASAGASIAPDLEPGEALWEIALQLCRPDSPGIGAALVAAWAPPEDIDLAALQWVLDQSLTLADVDRTGLLELEGSEAASMHRLIGAAVRKWSLEQDTDRCLERVEKLVHSPINLDAETYECIIGSLTSAELPIRLAPHRGRILHALGMRMEPLLGAAAGDTALQAAFRDLPEADARRRADCLHSRARCIYQETKDADSMDMALKLIDECLKLRAVAREQPSASTQNSTHLEVEEQRTVALRGLIKVQLAIRILRGIPVGPDALTDMERHRCEEVLQLARNGNEEIDSSLALREQLLPDDPNDADIIRGAYNQAMSSVNLAQYSESPVERRWLLDVAESRYERCRIARETMRPALPLAHIASCYAGLALVAYLRAVDRASPDPVDVRADVLRHASELLREALNMRESYERTDGADVAKTAVLEAKIALTRWTLQQSPDSLAQEAGELQRDLRRELPALSEYWFA